MPIASTSIKIEPSKEKCGLWDVLGQNHFMYIDSDWYIMQSGVTLEEAKAMEEWWCGDDVIRDVKYTDWKNMPENVRPSKP